MKLRTVAWVFVALAGLGAVGVLALGLAFARALEAPSPTGEARIVQIPAGGSLREIAARLEGEGLVRDARAFEWLARWRGADTGLRAGEYRLSPTWDAEKVLLHLREGRIATHPVVLPEGLTAAETAARLAEAGLVDAEAFLEVARSAEVAAELGVEGPGLEGYLYPETYHLPRGLPPRRIAAVLVEHFLAVWEEIAEEARAQDLGMREVATLASIVEKETGVAEERPLIASVFRNRLRRGMRLESDPTTIYGIPDFDGNLRRVHLEDAGNPYNTYRIEGLPPTPIANAGAESLRAVVRPADTEFLFFVSRNDGTHVFSRTFAEHNANVNRFQRRRSSR